MSLREHIDRNGSGNAIAVCCQKPAVPRQGIGVTGDIDYGGGLQTVDLLHRLRSPGPWRIEDNRVEDLPLADQTTEPLKGVGADILGIVYPIRATVVNCGSNG